MEYTWVMSWWARSSEMWEYDYDPLRPTENVVFFRLREQARLAALIRFTLVVGGYGR